MCADKTKKQIKMVQMGTAETVCLCRDVPNPKPSDVVRILKNQPEAMEKDLTIIDSDLIIPSVGEIDLIGVSKGCLVMVSIVSQLSSHHLGQAAGIYEWARENWSVLQHAYSGISTRFSIRICHLCADIQPQTQQLIPFLSNMPLEVFRYRCLESAQTRMLMLEKIVSDKKPEQAAVKATASPRHQSPTLQMRANVELTEEEIGDFFKDEVPPHDTEDEITYTGPYFNS